MEAPHNIVNYRREQCSRCPTPCEFQNNEEWRKEGDNACPKSRFMAYKTFVKVKWKGAGDAVASVAQPIAGLIDGAASIIGLKTNVRKCSACARRKEMLNQIMPFPNNKNNGF